MRNFHTSSYLFTSDKIGKSIRTKGQDLVFGHVDLSLLQTQTHDGVFGMILILVSWRVMTATVTSDARAGKAIENEIKNNKYQ